MNGDCTVGVENRQRIISLERETAELREADQDQWAAINALRNRLPVWATVVMTAGGTVGGAIIGVLTTLLRLRGV